jgi:ubiquinone/menaquinone biosynthesis C-methylase UbiE
VTHGAVQVIPALGIGRLTPLFDLVTEGMGLGRQFKRKVLDHVSLADDGSLLDLGCGTGTLAVMAKRRNPNFRVVGIDADDGILPIAQRKAAAYGVAVELVQTSAATLPFSDRSFSTVVSTLVFHHLPTAVKQQAIGEVHRVLVDGGTFLLADFGVADTVLLASFARLLTILRFPEGATFQDNVEGRILGFLIHAGFAVTEIAPRYRGIQFLLAVKEATPRGSSAQTA